MPSARLAASNTNQDESLESWRYCHAVWRQNRSKGIGAHDWKGTGSVRRLPGRAEVLAGSTDGPVLLDGAGVEAGGTGTVPRDYQDGPGLEEEDLKILAIRRGPRRMN